MKTTLHFVLGAAICSQFTVINSTLAAPAPSGRTQWINTPDSVPDGLSAPDWSSIRKQFYQHRHAAVPMAGGHQARNPGQRWQTRFDGRGFITKPDAAGWQWGLELKSYGFAGQERTVTGQPRVSAAGQRVTYDWGETLQEWFVNDTRGLEHGFTMHERPATEPKRSTFNIQQPTSKEAGAALGVECSIFDVGCFSNSNPLTFTLAVRGGLRPEVQADGRNVRFVDDSGAMGLTYAGLTVFDADGRKLPAHFKPVDRSRRSNEADSDAQKIGPVRLVTSATDQLRLVIDERSARYPLTIDPIAQQAYFKASNTAADDQFGLAVAVSGDTVVVGAGLEDSNATGANGSQNNNSAQDSDAASVFTGLGPNHEINFVLDGGSDYLIRFDGVPTLTYRLERALTVTGPWDSIATNTALASGFVEFHDTNAPPDGAFYRTVTP
jgi:hypothetical protein